MAAAKATMRRAIGGSPKPNQRAYDLQHVGCLRPTQPEEQQRSSGRGDRTVEPEPVLVAPCTPDAEVTAISREQTGLACQNASGTAASERIRPVLSLSCARLTEDRPIPFGTLWLLAGPVGRQTGMLAAQ